MSETGELPCLYCGTEPPPVDEHGMRSCCEAGKHIDQGVADLNLTRAALLTAAECLIQAKREARHANWLLEKYEQDRAAAAKDAQAMLDALLADAAMAATAQRAK